MKKDAKDVDGGVTETQKDVFVASGKGSEVAREGEEKAPPGKRIPRKVEVELPGPAPVAQTSGPKKPVSRARHSRAPSVVSSVDGNESPAKPPSVRGAGKASSSRSDSQEAQSDDDSVSVAESTTSKAPRKRKREPDRIQVFKDDAQCKDVEPHRALCAKCNRWVPLHDKRRYVMKFWIDHRRACPGARTSPSGVPPADDPVASKSGGPAQSNGDGRTVLESDSRTGEIRPHEVFCTSCNIWVQLDPTVPYVVANWKAHLEQCPGTIAAPPSDVAASADAPQPPSEPSSAQPGSAARPDAPSETMPPPQATPARKRARDDDDDGSILETPRTVRARPASYTPNRGKALWHTLTTPFRAFVQGFKEGMNASSSTSTISPSASSSSPSPSRSP
ncbi:hypothetical protein PsYK624_142920 [Phanerochaete sordida]|uniref:Uncharacterized protein n=1 Tax=Phanerochaete sordida TaxID=48140 RepID=A0A9P3GRC5_9APHY|nr:hypothetical protein PsYK624_142920 [Phanerochaete sordida]